MTTTIARLLDIGYPRAMILSGLSLLEQLSWSSLVVEQGHSTCTRILRHHPDYHANTMACRSLMMQMSMLTSEGIAKRRVGKARNRLRRLHRKCPARISGRSVLCADLMKIAQDKRKVGIYRDRHIGKFVIRNHSKIWAKMPKAQVAEFETEAGVRRHAAQEKLAQGLRAARGTLVSLEGEHARSATTVVPARMTSCKLTERQKTLLNEMWLQDTTPAHTMKEMRDNALVGIREPPAAFQALLQGFDVSDPGGEKAVVLSWVRGVCKLRKYLSTALFRIVSSSGEELLLRLLFALQNRSSQASSKSRSTWSPSARRRRPR